MSSKYKLSDSGEWFDLILKYLPVIFYALDENGIFTLSEGLDLSKIGLQPGEVVGRSALEMYKDYPGTIDVLHRALKGEYVIYHHNLGDYYMESRFVPQYDENDKIKGIIGITIDVGDRIRMEKSLQKEKNLSKAIMDSVPGILYLYDDESKLVYWNKNHEELTGYSNEEMLKFKFLDWFEDDEDKALVRKEVQLALQGKITAFDAKLRTKFGINIPMHFTAVGLKVDGKPFITGIGIDISELKHTQEKLMDINKSLENKVLERTKELRLANKEITESYTRMKEMQGYLIQSEKMSALGGLVAGITHEINTPIGVGITAASYLLEITEEFAKYTKTATEINKEELLSYLEDLEAASNIVLKNLDRAGKLVKSFKQVSADQASEPKRRFNIKEYLEEILLSLSPKIKKTKHTITINCEEKLEIDGYPGAFAQIISNLIINSLIHAYDPEDTGNIIISVSQLMNMIEIIYSDDGKGIPSSNLSKIFDPFFTTKRVLGGTGIGLSVVYNIVTQTFGGTIHCDSQVNKGTIFTIRLQVGGI
jgi:PAS domain S-box-containing protein